MTQLYREPRAMSIQTEQYLWLFFHSYLCNHQDIINNNLFTLIPSTFEGPINGVHWFFFKFIKKEVTNAQRCVLYSQIWNHTFIWQWRVKKIGIPYKSNLFMQSLIAYFLAYLLWYFHRNSPLTSSQHMHQWYTITE